jgi:hypothetical protein
VNYLLANEFMIWPENGFAKFEMKWNAYILLLMSMSYTIFLNLVLIFSTIFVLSD